MKARPYLGPGNGLHVTGPILRHSTLNLSGPGFFHAFVGFFVIVAHETILRFPGVIPSVSEGPWGRGRQHARAPYLPHTQVPRYARNDTIESEDYFAASSVARSARTSSLCACGLTFTYTFRITPEGSMMKVLRAA